MSVQFLYFETASLSGCGSFPEWLEVVIALFMFFPSGTCAQLGGKNSFSATGPVICSFHDTL